MVDREDRTNPGMGAVPRRRYPDHMIDSVRIELQRQQGEDRASVAMRLNDIRVELKDLSAGQAMLMATVSAQAATVAGIVGGLKALKWITPIAIGLTGSIVVFVVEMLKRGHP